MPFVLIKSRKNMPHHIYKAGYNLSISLNSEISPLPDFEDKNNDAVKNFVIDNIDKLLHMSMYNLYPEGIKFTFSGYIPSTDIELSEEDAIHKISINYSGLSDIYFISGYKLISDKLEFLYEDITKVIRV